MAGYLDFLMHPTGGEQQQGLLMQQPNYLRDLSLGLLKANQPSPYKKNMLGMIGEAALSADDMQRNRQQAVGATPSAIQEYKYYQSLPPEQQQEYLKVKRQQQWLNAGDRFENPAGAPPIPKGLPPQDQPKNAADKKYAEEKAGADAKSDAAATSTLPIIDQLRTFNKDTFSMPYADTAPVRGYTRVFGSSEQQGKQKNMDLLKQARTDLAAPLAKELGVNPTDRDFQATLDRIFDSNAGQDSREAQINALEQRILARRNARGGSGPMPATANNAISYQDYFK